MVRDVSLLGLLNSGIPVLCENQELLICVISWDTAESKRKKKSQEWLKGLTVAWDTELALLGESVKWKDKAFDLFHLI